MRVKQPESDMRPNHRGTELETAMSNSAQHAILRRDTSKSSMHSGLSYFTRDRSTVYHEEESETHTATLKSRINTVLGTQTSVEAANVWNVAFLLMVEERIFFLTRTPASSICTLRVSPLAKRQYLELRVLLSRCIDTR